MTGIEDDRADVVFGQPPFDLPDDLSGFSRSGLYRLPIDQLVKLPLAIATEIPLGTADVILVELLVEVVGPFSLTTCRR